MTATGSRPCPSLARTSTSRLACLLGLALVALACGDGSLGADAGPALPDDARLADATQPDVAAPDSRTDLVVEVDGAVPDSAADAAPPDALPDTALPDAALPDAAAPTTGACCASDGTCGVVDADRCPSGDVHLGLACAAVRCPPPGREALARMARALEVQARDGLKAYLDAVNIIGREYWNLDGDDPMYTVELLGKQGAPLTAENRLNTEVFVARYRVVRAAERLIVATENAAAVDARTRSSVTGFAQTLQAHALLLVLDMQHSNGVLRVEDLDDADPGGLFLSQADSLTYIIGLLDAGALHLQRSGLAFPFDLSDGFAGFDTPATFRLFNRALAARVALYMGDRARAIDALSASFIDLDGPMERGPRYLYDDGLHNPLYHRADLDLYTVGSNFLANAIPGDARVEAKTRPYRRRAHFPVPVALDGLVGDTQVHVVETRTDPLPIIRNEELLLIYAEAQASADFSESVAAIDRVRAAAGSVNYLGGWDEASLIDEILKQRRYGLFAEGHRWVDMRRLGRLDALPIDRLGDVVHVEFPRPGPETLGRLREL